MPTLATVFTMQTPSLQQCEQHVCVHKQICWRACSGSFTAAVSEHKGLETIAYIGMIWGVSEHFKEFLYNKYTFLCTIYICKMKTMCHKHFWETRRELQNRRCERSGAGHSQLLPQFPGVTSAGTIRDHENINYGKDHVTSTLPEPATYTSTCHPPVLFFNLKPVL